MKRKLLARWRRASRANVAIIFAVCLVVLLGFVALTVDMGRFWVVQGELQNAADAAALAGVRDLDGNSDKLLEARLTAQAFGTMHQAYQAPVQLDLNLDNDPAGNIVLGNWDFASRVFSPAGALTPAYLINAVQVNAHRTAAEGGAIPTTFGKLLGKSEQGLDATAIAVGGSPGGVCGFPLAVTECSILDDENKLMCNSELTFGQATTDTVGFTIYSTLNPTTPTVTCMVAKYLQSPDCATVPECDCSAPCVGTSTADGAIKISNGNNLSQTAVNDIVQAVALAGSSAQYVQVAVIGTPGLNHSNCGSFNYNNLQPIVGYVNMQLTGATFSPNKSVTAKVDCTQSGEKPPGGAFFGYKSMDVYLVK